ncbi:MAG: OadG family protein [bacterium]|nr:OadG family protein [bacterium]
MKKLRLVLCLVVSLFCMTACGTSEPKVLSPELEKAAVGMSEYMVQGIFANMTSADAAKHAEVGAEKVAVSYENTYSISVDGNGMIGAATSWVSAKEDMGDLVSIDGSEVVSYDGKEIITNVKITGTKRTAVVEFIFKDNPYLTMKSAATNVDYTRLEKMEKAGLNTLLGMGTVFVVLILISLIISCFGIFPKLQAASEAKKKKKAVAAVDNTVAQIIEKEELSDDLELVAVITAAIAAGTGSSTDGFVVRSIKRVKTNKWQKA